ncbi:MAG TPA: RuvA C-terminal domain-containing protein, partial [Arenimonas sp.]|nr:RuvA C-terminal domain-containing protein [Arenimonas sp.]
GGIAGVAGKAGAVPADPVSEASVALTQLGYKPAEIQRMLKQAQPGDSAEQIIRRALTSVLRG